MSQLQPKHLEFFPKEGNGRPNSHYIYHFRAKASISNTFYISVSIRSRVCEMLILSEKSNQRTRKHINKNQGRLMKYNRFFPFHSFNPICRFPLQLCLKIFLRLPKLVRICYYRPYATRKVEDSVRQHDERISRETAFRS